MYVSADEYMALSRDHAVAEGQLTQALEDAERDIDSLTYCRVRAAGVDALTNFQRELVKLAVVRQADFRAIRRSAGKSPGVLLRQRCVHELG